MRSERKKGRAFLARFMVLMMIVNLLSGINPNVARAGSADEQYFANNGKEVNDTSGVNLKETASGYNDGKFNVELLVNGSGSTTTKTKNLDVVLVVDRSGSMKDNGRMENAKKAAIAFVDSLLTDNSGDNVRVGLVSFAGNNGEKYSNPVLEAVNLQKNKNNLKNVINKYKPYRGDKAGTFTQAGLRKANELFDNNTNEKIIVLISDGEPTYAYSAGQVPDFNQIERASNNIHKDGYEIWSRGERNNGNNVDDDSWTKGYKTGTYKSGGFIGIGKKTWNWTPYYVKLVPDPEVVGDGKYMDTIIQNNTISEATAIKNSEVEVFSVGIGVNDYGKYVLSQVASPNRYYASNTYASDLAKILKELHNVIINCNIVNGSLGIQMNDKVDFKNETNFSDLSVEVVKTNYDAVSQEERDSFDKRKAEIKNKNNWNWNSNSKVLTLKNITLGEKEELKVTYKAELKEEWKDGTPYPLSQTAKLNLKALTDPDNRAVNFTIPTVKDTKTVNIVVNKKWVGDKVPEGVNEVIFNITPEAHAMNNTIIVKGNDNWTGKLENLPKYKNGKKINYEVTEVAGNNYEKVGEIKRTESSDGILTFEVTNKNTEKTSFTVRKDWASTPDELKFDVNVQLYADGTPLVGKRATIKKGETEATFANLPKYDNNGKEIKYSAKELSNDGKAIEDNGSLTNDKFNFTVTYDPKGDNAVYILNSCVNPENAIFDVDLSKTWEGGVGDKAEFVFTNTKTNTATSKVLNKDDSKGNTWKVKVSLPKYNSDGSKAVYTVTEKEVSGFTSTVSADTVDFEHTSVNVTNKRNTKKITVKKVWENTPEKLNTAVTVNLYKNGSDKVASQEIPVGKYEAVFENLPETDESGNPINYTFKEDGESNNKVTLGGNEFSVKYDTAENKIINTYTGLTTDTIKITINKKWDGDKGKQAEFVIKKGADEVATITLPKDGAWTNSVDVAKWETGSLKPAEYTVEEKEIKGFNSTLDFQGSISGEDKKVTFTNIQIKQKLTINKEWAGTPTNAAFTLTYNYGGAAKSEELSISNDKNTVTTDPLPVYDLNGDVISYTVTESKIEGYQAKQENQTFDLTQVTNGEKVITFKNTAVTTGDENTYKIIKNWQGKPADSAYFGLFDNNGNRITGLMDSDGNQLGDTIILSKNNGNLTTVEGPKWTRTINLAPLPKVYDDGKTRTYIFKEMTVPDTNGTNQAVENGGEVQLGNRTYKVTYVSNNNIFEFTNTDVTKANITVTKKWDGTPQQGLSVGLFKRSDFSSATQAPPTTSAVQAIEGTKLEETITFSDVNLTDNLGQDIEYVARELDANGNILEANAEQQFTLENRKYKVSYDDARKIITNTELIDITVKKEWADNVPESERQSAEIAIFNGDTEVNFVTLEAGLIHDNSGLEWQYTFTDLPYVESGYTVKETAINDVEVTDELKKLYDIAIDNENIKETATATIKNSFNLPTPDEGQIKVVKQWMVNPDNKEVTVKVFKKTIGTPDEPSKWVETDEIKKLSGSSVLETEFNMPEEAEDYYVLETAIDEVELTEDEIQTILNSDDLETVQYKIGEYDVLVQEPTDRVFFIKNSNDKELTELTVEKQWSEHTLARYVQPVKVQLYAYTEGVLEAIGSPVELNSAKWKTRFKGLDRYDDNGDEIRYYVAEVAVADEMKNDITLDDIQKGYTIGKYNVAIDGDGTNKFVITNDVNLIDITARKDWGTVSESNKKPVEFTLYSRMGAELKEVASQTLTGGDDNWTAEFKDQPRVDENGEEFTYYVFETKIDGTEVGIEPLTGVGYTVDPLTQRILYTTGTINNGKYSVVILGNAANGEVIVVKNSYTANTNSGGGGGDTPGGGGTSGTDPVVPLPDPTPTPTPDTTPTVDVPDDTTPQGDANINPDTDNDAEDTDDADDDDVLEVDNDDVPQGTAKTKDDAVKEDPIDVDGDPTPRGNANLPKTGGTTADFLSIIGLGLVGLGLVIKRRK